MPSYPATYPFSYYSGSAVAAPGTIPYRWPVSLAGRVLAVDIKSGEWKHQSIPLLRQQADQSTTPAETSLNPDGLWRRAGEDWDHGAGQGLFDRPESDKRRFSSSKGIDPWTPFQFSLLPATRQVRMSTNSTIMLAVAGNRLYMVDGTQLFYTNDVTGTPDVEATWVTITGTPGLPIQGIASDGFNVYISIGSNGIYRVDGSTTISGNFAQGSANGPMGYVKGRLLVANANAVYNIIGAGAFPATLYTHPNTNFSWIGFAGGPTHIYMAGFSGDKSLIYKTTIKADGTTLDVPSVAGELPDGEIIRSIDSYLGFIFLGTDKGARFCQARDDGNLTISAPILTPSAVRCFEGQDRYVWFGWSNYDGTSTGLGRLSLASFTEESATGALIPAYASDIMATAQGNVLSCVTFQNRRCFSVSGAGVWSQKSTLVTEGTLDTGVITYGLPDNKTALFLAVRTLPLSGDYSVAIAADSGVFIDVGSQGVAGTVGTELSIVNTIAERLELRFTLTRGTSITGPIITRYTLKSSPAAIDGPAEFIIVPFMLHNPTNLNNEQVYCDVRLERDRIKLLRKSREVVVYQEATDAYNVIVDAYEWRPYNWSKNPEGGYGVPDGTMITQLKRVN